MKFIIKPKKSKNYIVTLAIGKKFFNDWKKYSLPSWKLYCKKNDIGIICFDKELISRKHKKWKKIIWQQLLIGSALKNYNVENICYVDTDILINPFSPNIFNKYNKKKFLISSNINNLPYDLNIVKKRVAFYRKEFLNNKYPLDSGLFANLNRLYRFSNLEPQKDEICSGVYVYNIKYHANLLERWFYLYDNKVVSMTSGGIQIHLGYHIIKTNNYELLDYKFQAYWMYEMVMNYPFLYFTKNEKIITECVTASIMNNYFLHFAGAWSDGQMWKRKIFNKRKLNFYNKLNKYYLKKVSGKSVGYISQK